MYRYTKRDLPDNTVALIDVDSMLYMVAYGEKSIEVAKRTIIDMVVKIIRDLQVSQSYVFIKGSGNFRYEVDIEYKQQRGKGMADDYRQRVNKLYEVLQQEFTPCDGAEADDFCSIYNYDVLDNGDCPVVCHIDKDLNMIPGWHYHYRKKELYWVSIENAYAFMMMQLLTGDPADNIKGIHRLGPVTAKKIIERVNYSKMLDIVLDIWKDKQPETWKHNFTKAANCLLIRSSIDDLRPLTFEELMDRLKWPLEEDAVHQTTTELIYLAGNKEDPIKGDILCQKPATGSSSKTDQQTPSDSSMQSSDQPEGCTSEESNVSVSPPKKKRGRPAKQK